MSQRDLSLAAFSGAASRILGPQLFFLRTEMHSSTTRADVGATEAGTSPPGECRERAKLPRVDGSRSWGSEQNSTPDCLLHSCCSLGDENPFGALATHSGISSKALWTLVHSYLTSFCLPQASGASRTSVEALLGPQLPAALLPFPPTTLPPTQSGAHCSQILQVGGPKPPSWGRVHSGPLSRPVPMDC